MTPEESARELIDKRLEQSGWVIQDMRQVNPMASLGVAVREYPTSTGPVDYSLQEFSNAQFGTVHTLTIGGVPYFVGHDVAQSLGYRNPRDALMKHVDEEDRDTVALCDGTPGNPNQVVINESGLYSLILASRRPEAKRVKRWLTGEVLSAIRQRGIYARQNLLEDPDLLLQALTDLQEEQKRSASLQQTVVTQTTRLEDITPRAEYCEQVLRASDAVSVTLIAKGYGWSARRMNRFLQEKGVQYRRSGAWVLYEPYAHQGYTRSETAILIDQRGETHVQISTKWTQKGRALIHSLMTSSGVLRPGVDVCAALPSKEKTGSTEK